MTGLTLAERNLWTVLGLPFDRVNGEEAVALIEQCIRTGSRCFLSTPNLNFVVQAYRDKAFYRSVLESDLVVADGMPIIWVARLLGIPLPERVAGSCLFESLEQQKPDRPIRVFFFGGQGDAAEKAAANLAETSQSMECCGFLNPGLGTVDSMSTDKIIQQINRARADFLLVALGAKKGQHWIQHNRSRLEAPVISHLGAVINFVAGDVERAPKLWQRLGVEWLWRVKQEPGLMRRYISDGLWFIYLLVARVFPLAIYDSILQLTAGPRRPLKISSNQIDHCLELALVGSATATNCRQLKLVCEKALSQPCTILRHVQIDCSELVYIDSAAVAVLLIFEATLTQRGQSLTFLHINGRIKRLIGLQALHR